MWRGRSSFAPPNKDNKMSCHATSGELTYRMAFKPRTYLGHRALHFVRPSHVSHDSLLVPNEWWFCLRIGLICWYFATITLCLFIIFNVFCKISQFYPFKLVKWIESSRLSMDTQVAIHCLLNCVVRAWPFLPGSSITIHIFCSEDKLMSKIVTKRFNEKPEHLGRSQEALTDLAIHNLCILKVQPRILKLVFCNPCQNSVRPSLALFPFNPHTSLKCFSTFANWYLRITQN